MLADLPATFYLFAALTIGLMSVSAFFLGAPVWWQRGLARAGLVASAGVLFVGVFTYVSVLAAVIVVLLPLCLLLAWFTDLLGGFF